jgi:hypothetical protein
MKILLTLLMVILIIGGTQAQNSIEAGNHKGNIPKNIPKRTHNSINRGTQFYIDYDYADFLLWGDPLYVEFIWNCNMRYDSVDGGNEEMVVAFNQLYDYNTAATIDNDDVTTIFIDSVFANIGHENNSGTDDTIIMKIIKLDAATGYPTATVMWADTTIVNYNLSPTNDWFDATTLSWNPQFLTTEDRFGIRVEYYGSKMDTFGILAGFPNIAPLGTCTDYAAAYSSFFPNSFSLWSEYDYAGLLPQSAGGDLYYDCDNSGDFDPSSDGVNYIQNINFWALVDVETFTGINDPSTSIKNVSLTPNPAMNHSQLAFTLEDKEDVKINLYDLSGRLLKEFGENHMSKGNHKQAIDVTEISSGVYILSLKAGANQINSKLVITR